MLDLKLLTKCKILLKMDKEISQMKWKWIFAEMHFTQQLWFLNKNLFWHLELWTVLEKRKENTLSISDFAEPTSTLLNFSEQRWYHESFVFLKAANQLWILVLQKKLRKCFLSCFKIPYLLWICYCWCKKDVVL
jgi:hypothetical protein